MSSSIQTQLEGEGNMKDGMPEIKDNDISNKTDTAFSR